MFSKSIAMTLLFSALAVVRGAPASVESIGTTLVPRDRSGTQIGFTGNHQVTLGTPLASGSQGTVHHVTAHTAGGAAQDHTQVLAKEFKTGHDHAQEISNLQQVGQLHGTAQHDGREFALIHKQEGVPLKDTQAYKKSRGLNREAIKGKAAEMVGDKQLEHATQHGILHDDLHGKNALFTEQLNPTTGKHELTGTNFVDWGKAKQAPAKAAGADFSQAQKDKIKLDSSTYFSMHNGV